MRILLLACCLLLAACGVRTPVPPTATALDLPQTLHLRRDDGQDWLLVIQGEGPALRWSLFDPLGMPLARQLLERGEWRNDGLLPPNREARELFAALLFALRPRAELDAYPAGSWSATASGRRLRPDWRIDYDDARHFSLRHGDAGSYRVSPLEND